MSDNHTGRHLRITISISPQLQTQMAPCPTSSSLCCLIQLKATASERKTRKEESKKEEKEENKSSKLQWSSPGSEAAMTFGLRFQIWAGKWQEEHVSAWRKTKKKFKEEIKEEAWQSGGEKQTPSERYYSKVFGLWPKSKHHHNGNTDQPTKKKRRKMIILQKQCKKSLLQSKHHRTKYITGHCVLKKKWIFSEGSRGIPVFPTLLILWTVWSYLVFFLKAQLQSKHCFHYEKGGGGRIKKKKIFSRNHGYRERSSKRQPPKTQAWENRHYLSKKPKQTIQNFALSRCSWSLPEQVYSHYRCKIPALETACSQPLSNLDHIKTSCSGWWLIKIHQDTQCQGKGGRKGQTKPDIGLERKAKYLAKVQYYVLHGINWSLRIRYQHVAKYVG